MSVMVIVFFLMYTTFTSLFSSLDLSHIYAYQITRLKMVNIYVNIIRFCFYAALLVAGIYVIKSLTMYRKNHRKINHNNYWLSDINKFNLMFKLYGDPA